MARIDNGRGRTTVVHATPLEPGAGTVLLLTVTAGIGQFAASVYLPSMPSIAQAFGADMSTVQLTLAIFLVALGAGQLFAGPLADRFGRRPVLFFGFGIFLAGTLGCAFSRNIEMLLFARAVQGFGAASGIVIARAAARDSFEGTQLARLVAMVMATFAMVPGISPLLGGITEELIGWRASFWLTLGVGAIVLTYTYRRLPETGTTRLVRLDAKEIAGGYGAILRDRPAMACAAAGALVYGTLSGFHAGAPSLYIALLGVSPVEFGLYPVLAVAAFVAGSLVSRRFAANTPPPKVAGRGLALMLVGLGLMLLFPLAGIVHKHLFTVTLVVHSVGLGLFIPTVNAMMLSRFSTNVGFASGTCEWKETSAQPGTKIPEDP